MGCLDHEHKILLQNWTTVSKQNTIDSFLYNYNWHKCNSTTLTCSSFWTSISMATIFTVAANCGMAADSEALGTLCGTVGADTGC